MSTSLDIIRDDEKVLIEKLRIFARGHDAVLTSGGAWTGDRDLVVRVLTKLGWRKVYHRVRNMKNSCAGVILFQCEYA
jgi:molybdopterin molybdotransferase